MLFVRSVAVLLLPWSIAPPTCEASFHHPALLGAASPSSFPSPPSSSSRRIGRFHPPPPSSSSLSLSYDEDDDDAAAAAVGAARAMLFDDQHRAANQRAEVERALLEPNMVEMGKSSNSSNRRPKPKKKKKRAGTTKAVGFGGGGARGSSTARGGRSAAKPSTTVDGVTRRLAATLERDGVVLLPGAMGRGTALDMRDCLVDEIEVMRDDVRRNPDRSVSYFYVPAEIHFGTPRGYVLLPFRDAATTSSSGGDGGGGGGDGGPIVRAARELLGPGARLGDLFAAVVDGDESQLYDFCALRTEPGAARQQVHSDTPYQEIPGLFCAFVALQDVTMEMGGTLFIPGTHTRTEERLNFDDRGRRDDMLAAAEPRYTMLRAGDAAVFDMRVLHAGLPNLPEEEGGAPRLLLAVTFRNLAAREDLGHRPNIRPGYVGKYTLGDVRRELASDAPFADAGDGMP